MSVARMPAPPFAATEVRAMLAKLLASEEFARAQRMSKLLSYLVEMLLSHAGELNEYMIGIDVFARHPATYNTGDDPIVRVQVGRLRERLRQYYASGTDAELVLTIPLGGYMPDIRRIEPWPAPPVRGHLLALLPLTCLSDHADSTDFTCGLNEQLAHQLFQEFGNSIIAPSFAAAAAHAGASHCIEGSLRLEGHLTRIAIRLVDAGGCIAWALQFDFSDAWSIALQEELARLVATGLKLYFSHEAHVSARL